MRRIAMAVVLVASLIVSGASVASAAPAHHSVPNYPATYKGPRVSDHPAGACAGTWNVWTDWVYNWNQGDDSLKVGVSQEWEGDASNAYCGQMKSIVAWKSQDCSPGSHTEPVTTLVTEMFTTGGTLLGGTTSNGGADGNCSAFNYLYPPAFAVSCGTNFHSYGSVLEKNDPNGEPNDPIFTDPADGESVATFGNTHDLCFN